ncbi:chondroitinase family protein [Endozoicomonas sp.]|uniref:chondroitinase family protein n=1 Tax=Endozoicomonas sp. TaxID=1892382 RepID=UPI003AF8F9E4
MNKQFMNAIPFTGKRQLLTAAVSAALMLSGCSLLETRTAQGVSDHQPGGAMYFFENGLPETISTDSNSTIQLSGKHYRDGAHSLQWNFNNGSQLTFDQPVGFKHFKANGSNQSRHSFLVWIYSEAPVNDHLTFQFGEDDQVKTQFKMKLDFTGWRHAIVPFGEMEGSPTEMMNRLTLIAPESITSGSLYIDQMMLSIPVDPRWPTRDNQLPFVNLAADSAPNSHWLSLYRFDQLAKKAAVSNSASTEAVISERFNTLLMDEVRPLTDKKLEGCSLNLITDS